MGDVSFILFMVVVALVAQGIPIWLAVKAKPIGNKPYRWGTYVALITGVVAISIGLIGFTASIKNNLFGISFLCVMMLSAVATTVGLMRRQKFGVIAFILTYSLLLIAVPLLDAVQNHPSTEAPGSGLPVLIFAGITTGYLIKRWKFMGAVDRTPPPLIVQP